MEEKEIDFIKTKSYSIINEDLGSGACGKTVLLKDNSLDELFVCKKYMPLENVDIKYFYEMFKNEIKIMYKLNSPNIVRIFNYYLYDEYQTGYIIMEYIEGSTIDKYFEDGDYIFSASDENEIFLQLIKAFDCLEKNNIIHRDIRPSNIMIDKKGQVKIIDFGLGKDFSQSNLSRDSLNNVINRWGMEKIPCEMYDGKYNHKTDMFCLAELYNRLLKKNGIKDFKYKAVLNKMMASEIDERFTSFQEILDNINAREFSLLEISAEDKRIYKKFSDFIYYNISSYTSKFSFEEELDNVFNGLEEVLNNNCFETYLIANDSLFSVFIKNGYRYNNSNQIEIETVKSFYDWLQTKDISFQSVVLKNFKAKLSNIKEEKKEFQLPF